LRRHRGTERLPILVGFIAAFGLGGIGWGTASAGTLYVDDDDPSCGGDAPCYSSIQDAVDEAGEGDTIRVAAGTYPESIIIDKGVMLLGAMAGIDPGLGCWGDDVSRVSGGPGSAGVTITALGVTLDGFEVSGFEHYGIYVGNGNDPPGLTMAVSDVEIVCNRIHGNGKYGIQLIALGENVSVTDVLIRQNHIHGNGRNGLKLVDVTDCILDSNLVADNGFGPQATKPEYRFGLFLEDERYNDPVYRPCIRNTLIGNSFTGNAAGAINMEAMGRADGPYWSSTVFLEETVVVGNDFHGDAASWGLKVDNDYRDDGRQDGFGPIATIDAIDNWWGHLSGPYHGNSHPTGQGSAVSDHALFDPWSATVLDPRRIPKRCLKLDVRPNNTRNQINTNARQQVPIAILGDAGFDPVEEVDIDSIVIHGGIPSPTRFDTDDVNGDEHRDLTLYFRARGMRKPDRETECGNPDATVEIEEGVTTTGEPVGGFDYVSWLGPDCK
jgi:hypothetical protein